MSAPKAEWQGYIVDNENVEDIPFVHGAAVDSLAAIFAHDRDSAYTDVG